MRGDIYRSPVTSTTDDPRHKDWSTFCRLLITPVMTSSDRASSRHATRDVFPLRSATRLLHQIDPVEVALRLATGMDYPAQDYAKIVDRKYRTVMT